MLIVATPTIYLVGLFGQLQWHKHEQKELLESQQLSSIKIPTHKLVWKEQGKELIIANEYFDVHSISYKNDSVLITGIYDAQEKNIEKTISKSWQHHPNQKQFDKSIFSFFSLTWFSNIYSIDYTYKNFDTLCLLQNTFYIHSKSWVFLEYATPPPDAII
jgi:hypothetical protein